MKTEYQNNNVYAKNIKGAVKHVSQVESGRKGYYCLGCQAEMEARKGQIRVSVRATTSFLASLSDLPLHKTKNKNAKKEIQEHGGDVSLD